MRRQLALIALPVVLATGTLSPRGTQQAAALTAKPGPACVPGGNCVPGGAATPTPVPSAPGSPTSSPAPVPSPVAVTWAAPTPGLVASTATSVLTAGSATVTGFTYAGNVDMPVAGGGTETMMKFTADAITLAGGVSTSVTQGGLTTVTSSPTLAFSGGVTLYATRLSGSLLGVPVTFTPSAVVPIPGVVPITLTGVTTDQPLISADSLTAGPLSLGFGG